MIIQINSIVFNKVLIRSPPSSLGLVSTTTMAESDVRSGSDGFILSTAGRKYIQLWEIVCGPGTDRIRENVLFNLDQPTLRQSLDARRHIFKRLLKQNKIYDKQFSTLFPRDDATKEPDHSSIDISLWVTICKTVTVHRTLIDYSRPLTDTDVAWEHDAIRLRDVRNYLSHLIQPKFTDEDYQRHSTVVRQALMRLGLSDEELMKQFTDGSEYELSDDAKNYLRLRVLVVEVGTERIRFHILKNINASSLHDAVTTNKEKLSTDINPSQRAVLYPPGRKTFETDVDISLWTLVLRKLWDPPAGVTVDWKRSPRPDQLEWFHDVCRVRDVRNYLVHLPKPTVAGNEFEKRWSDLSSSLVRLGADEELIGSYMERDFHGMQLQQINTNEGPFEYMSRSQWGAREPAKPLVRFDNVPTRFVIISHCVYTRTCHNTHECYMQIKNIQRYHIDDRDFDDIAYNYVVANDGVVYEGRGCDYISSTAFGWNKIAFGICYMGAYDADDVHCEKAVESLRQLLAYLVCCGKLQPNYILYGLRQVRPMHDAPKAELYDVIKQWPEWREYDGAER